MKFKGAGIVWDKRHDKPLCKFVDGVYETNDTKEQAILKELGYEYEVTSKKATTRKQKVVKEDGK